MIINCLLQFRKVLIFALILGSLKGQEDYSNNYDDYNYEDETSTEGFTGTQGTEDRTTSIDGQTLFTIEDMTNGTNDEVSVSEQQPADANTTTGDGNDVSIEELPGSPTTPIPEPTGPQITLSTQPFPNASLGLPETKTGSTDSKDDKYVLWPIYLIIIAFILCVILCIFCLIRKCLSIREPEELHEEERVNDTAPISDENPDEQTRDYGSAPQSAVQSSPESRSENLDSKLEEEKSVRFTSTPTGSEDTSRVNLKTPSESIRSASNLGTSAVSPSNGSTISKVGSDEGQTIKLQTPSESGVSEPSAVSEENIQPVVSAND